MSQLCKKYIPDGQPFNLRNYLNFMLLKRGTFEHEQELRFMIVDFKRKKGNKNFFVDIEWRDIIEAVYYSSDFTQVEKLILKDLLINAGVDLKGGNKIPVCQVDPYKDSALQSDPFFEG